MHICKMASSVSLSRKTAYVQCSTWQVIKSLKTDPCCKDLLSKHITVLPKGWLLIHIHSYFREILGRNEMDLDRTKSNVIRILVTCVYPPNPPKSVPCLICHGVPMYQLTEPRMDGEPGFSVHMSNAKCCFWEVKICLEWLHVDVHRMEMLIFLLHHNHILRNG